MKKGIVGLLSLILGTAFGASGVNYLKNKTILEKEKKVDKFKSYYNMLNQWLILKQENKSFEKYFIDNEFKTIAIYGMGEMGNRLYDELKNSNVEVKYAIDKNAESTYSELNVVNLDDDLEEVDVIVVSAIFAFDEIEEQLKDTFDCPIVSLDDVVFEL
ncbi:hypothetical protein Ana3638_07795 [Anaerocolumna sedimenticola]|uniref:D-isomer specific 2-hydroxyacid dehydrogenase NAD-binding domain-containing protein n=1 Tax=Anaerocolumna sedimenticola TaxID=2696063 RepID=A0A6P1TK69_9FIRM|nr:NAD(P)-dependent oxidoreductase [Anaerocolumna sedimenticola]QHQ60687.1 hypothetical protein Ana3638_07795 [Anaerocolumna sedimenticola]